MIGKILKELTALKDVNETTSNQILIDPKSGGSESTERGAGQYKRSQGI